MKDEGKVWKMNLQSVENEFSCDACVAELWLKAKCGAKRFFGAV